MNNKYTPREYEEMINLEGLDRQLRDDVIRFANRGDNDGVELAQLARREAQNRMLQITLDEEVRK